MPTPAGARPTVARVETFPLEHTLPDGGYGTAKGRVPSRVCTLVKVTDSNGVVGWGEAFGVPDLVRPYLARYAQALVGRSVDDKEAFAQQLIAESYHFGAGGLHVAALSGLDIALWDVQARGFDVPIGSLLGGVVRDAVDTYASIGYITHDADPAEFREQLRGAASEGFTSAKIKIGTTPEQDRERCEIALEELGPSGVLMVDYNSNATVDTVLRSLRAIADLDPRWVEEPLPPYAPGWEHVRTVGIPIAAGEALYTRYGFRDPIARGQMDIVQPDVTKCGGFTEAKLIAQMAQAWNLRVSPHCWGTGVAEAACLQLLSSLPDLPFGQGGGTPQYLEFDRGFNPLREAVLSEPIRIADGAVAVPTGAGLGVEINEAAVRELAISSLRIDTNGLIQ